MSADEKSDEAVVPWKRPNKGRQLPAEVVEGRASPEGNSRQGGRSSDTEPKYHVDPIGGCAPDRRRDHTPPWPHVPPRGGAPGVSSARREPVGVPRGHLPPTPPTT